MDFEGGVEDGESAREGGSEDEDGISPTSQVEYSPPAPRRPIIAGSRWCS